MVSSARVSCRDSVEAVWPACPRRRFWQRQSSVIQLPMAVLLRHVMSACGSTWLQGCQTTLEGLQQRQVQKCREYLVVVGCIEGHKPAWLRTLLETAFPGQDQKAKLCHAGLHANCMPCPFNAPASPGAAGAKAESAAVAEASNRSAVPCSTAAPGTPAARAAMGARPGPLTAGMSSWGIAPGSSLGAGADPAALYPDESSHLVTLQGARQVWGCFRGLVSPG